MRKTLIIAMLLLAPLATGCTADATGSTTANATETDDGPIQAQAGDYTLEIHEKADGSGAEVRVESWVFDVPWDGLTPRCPCRGYSSSVLEIDVEHFADGPRVKVHRARLGLSASVVEDADHPGNVKLKLSDDKHPTAADYLAMIDTMNDEELALINKIAETDFAAYIRQAVPEDVRTQKSFALFWHDADELGAIADMLTERVLQPTAGEDS